jgi:hypothetical protein
MLLSSILFYAIANKIEQDCNYHLKFLAAVKLVKITLCRIAHFFF